MSKAILAAFLLTAAAPGAVAPAVATPTSRLDDIQLCDAKTEKPAEPKEPTGSRDGTQIVRLRRGQSTALPWTALTRVHILDGRVAQVRIEAANVLNVTGLETGETWLEIWHGAREVTLLKVRVGDADDALDEKTLGHISGGQFGGVGTSAATASTTPGVAPVTPGGTAATPPLTGATQARPILPRLQIAVRSSYGLDTERLRFVSGDPTSPTANTLTARRSFQALAVTLRRRLGARDILILDVPYLRRSEEVKFAGNSSRTHSAGLGDVMVGFERVFRGLARGTAEGSAGLNLVLPTGRSIYSSQRDRLPLGSGHYEIGGFVGLRKIADPLFAGASLGLNYTVARRLDGVRIAPGLGYSLQTGLGYAINDRLVLSEQLAFSRRTNVNLIGSLGAADALSEKSDQAYFTQSLVYNPRRGTRSLRLFFTLGLNDASLDYILGLTSQR